MKLSIWKVAVLMLASAAVAAAVVGTAVGGTSIKKIVKKEVTKQLKGKTGPEGPRGPQGLPGAPGTSNVTLVRTTLTVANNNTDSDFADCPTGQRATGGGVGWDGGASFGDGHRVADSQPVTAAHDLTNPPTTTGSVATGWYGNLASPGTGNTGYVWVLCVPNP